VYWEVTHEDITGYVMEYDLDIPEPSIVTKMIWIREASEKKKKEERRQKAQVNRATRRKALMAKYGDKAAVEAILARKIYIGMTREMVLDSWGKPDDINKTTHSFGVHEQWVYGIGQYVYLEDGIVTTIQQ
jgi:hypothetical protein